MAKKRKAKAKVKKKKAQEKAPGKKKSATSRKKPKSAPAAARKSSAKKAPAEQPVKEATGAPPRRNSAQDLAQRQREISVSEFFTRNRHLLGFDNPRRALLTTIKEGVDNALDACEEAGILPEVLVAIEPCDGHDDRYRVIVEDNGPGIVRRELPKIFGKLLYGSKFHRLKMSRGQQGIGISAAGMYGQLTTGQPSRILSRTGSERKAHYYELQVDTRKNHPQIIKEEERDWDKPHGTRVEIELEARYQRGRQSVDDYLDQTAIANPHVAIRYRAPGEDEVVWKRVTKILPEEPTEIKPHLYGIELGTLMKMLHATKSRTLHGCLRQDFCRVSARNATEICETAGLSVRARPKRIARGEADRLYRAIQQTKLRRPPTDCIVPIGEELMLKGLKQGVSAEFYCCVSRPPAVYRGNPFIVEVAIGYGGELPAEGACRLMRFANRVPLQYQQGACGIASAVSDIKWRSYGLDQPGGGLPQGPLTIMVHVASVWVPFTSESKEAIAHYPEIIKEIKLALQECGRKLGLFVKRRRRAAEAERKRQHIERYIPHIGVALREILSLSARQEGEVVRRLEDMLERSRKG